MEKRVKFAVFVAWFLLCAAAIFPQDELTQRGSIPEDLLRPRREEAPRYPVDMVIGTLGQGQAPREAYDIAKNAAAAFLSGNMNASVFSPVSKAFVESCMSMLNAINPQFYRLGGGREEPDGSVSFLVRFVGREQGITGELFVRFEEHRPEPQSAEPQPEAIETDADGEDVPAEQDIPVQKTWLFEDLILEEARSREEENRQDRHRFDFSPYERIF